MSVVGRWFEYFITVLLLLGAALCVIFSILEFMNWLMDQGHYVLPIVLMILVVSALLATIGILTIRS